MFIKDYLKEVEEIAILIKQKEIEDLVQILRQTRDAKGRLFILGVGGSSSTCGHAVNDFRKIAGIESYAPTDGIAELTAITNDAGWEYVFEHWLIESHLNPVDTIMIFSVGGGSVKENISVNLVYGIQYAKKRGCKIIGVVGRDGGYLRQNADASVLIPTVHKDRITPHVEEWETVILHLLVSHPLLQKFETTWESKQEF
jgi:D-sedoheptulose 7-phosphate isomerase